MSRLSILFFANSGSFLTKGASLIFFLTVKSVKLPRAPSGECSASNPLCFLSFGPSSFLKKLLKASAFFLIFSFSASSNCLFSSSFLILSSSFCFISASFSAFFFCLSSSFSFLIFSFSASCFSFSAFLSLSFSSFSTSLALLSTSFMRSFSAFSFSAASFLACFSFSTASFLACFSFSRASFLACFSLSMASLFFFSSSCLASCPGVSFLNIGGVLALPGVDTTDALRLFLPLAFVLGVTAGESEGVLHSSNID